MASTNSLSFPYIFDVARNSVSVAADTASVVSRVKLLILTEPTELHMNPGFGVGLKRHIWQYNRRQTSSRKKIRNRHSNIIQEAG